MLCTLCNTNLKNKIDNVYFICDYCSAYVKDTKQYISLKKEKERYKEHNNDVDDKGYQRFTSPITNTILEKYNTHHLGLDYGCGTGPVISKQLQDKGYKLQLFDPFFYVDEMYLNFTYDYIFSCEVFEHFYQPKEEIEKLLRLLKPKGRLLIMTHQYDGKIPFSKWYYRKDPTHVFIYTQKTFEFIAKKYQLTIEKKNNRFVVLKK